MRVLPPLVLVLFLALAAGCARAPAEQRLRDTIAAMETAIEANQVNDFLDGVSSEFTGNGGQYDRRSLHALLRAMALRHQRVHQLQAGGGAERYRHRNGAVERHDRGRLHPLERPVELRNARPIGILEVCRLGVQGGNGRLYLVGAGPAMPDRLFEKGAAFGNEPPVPLRTILCFEQHRGPAVVEACARPRMLQHQQRRQRENFRFPWE